MQWKHIEQKRDELIGDIRLIQGIECRNHMFGPPGRDQNGSFHIDLLELYA